MSATPDTRPIDWRNLPPVPEEDRPVVGETWRPSQTFLRIHDECDRAAMLYLKYRSGAGGHELNRGSIWHDVAAMIARHAMEHGEAQVDPETGKDLLIEYLDANPHLQVKASERDDLRWMVVNFCLAEWFDPGKILALESTFELVVGEFTIVGRIDRAQTYDVGAIEVIDYKTAQGMPDAEEFRKQTFREDGSPRWAGNFQTNLYALACAFGTFDGFTIADGVDRFKLTLVFPRFLYPDGLGRRTVVVSREQLLDFRFDLEQQLRRLRDVNLAEGRWQPTPGEVACRQCPAEYACPLPRLLRAESQLASAESVEDLERLATSAEFMSKQATDLRKRVKKRAETLSEEDPSVLDLGEGMRGIRCGKDVALVFQTGVRETVDKAGLAQAVDRARNEGTEFDLTQHVKVSTPTEFKKRRLKK
jgi:hypothetical protein